MQAHTTSTLLQGDGAGLGLQVEAVTIKPGMNPMQIPSSPLPLSLGSPTNTPESAHLSWAAQRAIKITKALNPTHWLQVM